jgi:farnesyl-diphosphate farnesyltransferase
LTQWQTRNWPGLTPDETRLMGAADGLALWQIYAAIPAADRAIIQRWVHAMIDGMAALDDAVRPPRFVERRGVQVLETVTDYNEYCYIVAGTVGYLSTELVIRHYEIDDERAARLRATCEACGRGLQKTNIVKDFAEDLRRGVSYLPASWLAEADDAPLELRGASPEWAHRVLNDVLNELAEATTYLLTLPTDAEGYRMASLLCLLPAYQTMLAAAQAAPTLFTAEHHVKISRDVMERCLTDAAVLWADNDAIATYTADLHAALQYHFVLA